MVPWMCGCGFRGSTQPREWNGSRSGFGRNGSCAAAGAWRRRQLRPDPANWDALTAVLGSVSRTRGSRHARAHCGLRFARFDGVASSRPLRCTRDPRRLTSDTAHPPGAFQNFGFPLVGITQSPQVGLATICVTVPQPGPDLDPHGPDLRKTARTSFWRMPAHGVSAGQRAIAMCPRGDLNPHRCYHPLAPQASASAYSATRTGCRRSRRLAKASKPGPTLRTPPSRHRSPRDAPTEVAHELR